LYFDFHLIRSNKQYRTIGLVREISESMKPCTIAIDQADDGMLKSVDGQVNKAA